MRTQGLKASKTRQKKERHFWGYSFVPTKQGEGEGLEGICERVEVTATLGFSAGRCEPPKAACSWELSWKQRCLSPYPQLTTGFHLTGFSFKLPPRIRSLFAPVVIWLRMDFGEQILSKSWACSPPRWSVPNLFSPELCIENTCWTVACVLKGYRGQRQSLPHGRHWMSWLIRSYYTLIWCNIFLKKRL